MVDPEPRTGTGKPSTSDTVGLRTERTGSWAAADVIAPSGLRFFLGLLDHPLILEEAGAPRRRGHTAMQPDADPIQIAATARMLVGVARDLMHDSEWSEVTSRIE